MSEIIVATIALLGVLATAWFGYRSKMAEREAAGRELKFQAAALDFGAFLSEWDGCHADLSRLMEETAIDRFLILRAWNGNLQPRWTTSVFQMRQGKQEPISYIHIDLDVDYVDRLKAAVQTGQMVMDVANSSASLIRDVYEAEGIRHAVWFHLETLDGGNNTAAITYCSFATHQAEPLDSATITHCRRIASRLRGVAATFRHP